MDVVFRPEPTELQMSGMTAIEERSPVPGSPGLEGMASVGYLPEPEPLISLEGPGAGLTAQGELPMPKPLDQLEQMEILQASGGPIPKPLSELS